ncbi:hypothetical protein [Thermococcus pacificus]|uniref:hypothetical protein n=1 Tax=Thermococcus pacificus TaxID=71998 RepID=UPI003002D19C
MLKAPHASPPAKDFEELHATTIKGSPKALIPLRRFPCIVTGDSLSQVASQILANLYFGTMSALIPRPQAPPGHGQGGDSGDSQGDGNLRGVP